MPGLDKTGPAGGGPMTGGGWGICHTAGAAADQPSVAGTGRGRRFGGGLGQKRGRCRAWRQANDFGAGRRLEPTAEIEKLRAVAESLEKMLDRLSRRIQALRAVKPGQQ